MYLIETEHKNGTCTITINVASKFVDETLTESLMDTLISATVGFCHHIDENDVCKYTLDSNGNCTKCKKPIKS